ncbi:MAG: tetratricopeptide repeat protein [Hyphomicrobiales bacterium]|nr:tetratricopeptide repeat protein [Hyphomicrobiales bacterium]MBV9428113.1 tetratricopeptide repeat protein [Bradyrhizobiaceae bacterium]
MPSDAEQRFAQALSLHQSGRLDEAERLYRQVLKRHPDHLDALNLLGVLALQAGRNEEAIQLVTRALARNDRVADFHNNIAEAYRRTGRLDEAAAHFAKAAELEPAFVEAHQNLAATLRAQKKWDLAAARYRRLLEIRPQLAEAHSGLGDVLLQQGQFADAGAHYRQALAFRLDRAEVHNNLGVALQAQRQLREAATAFERAGALKPDFADAHRNLAAVLLELAQPGRALDSARRAVELTWSVEDKLLFCRCAGLAPRSLADPDGKLRPVLLRAWSELWTRPNDLAPLTIAVIKSNPAVAAAIARAKGAMQPSPLEKLWAPSGLAAPAGERLLRYLLESAPVPDADLERVLTATRRIVLDLAASDAAERVAGEELAFCCALARQCFVNEYVFACTGEEAERARGLRERLSAAMQSGASVPPLWPAAVAAYEPLHGVPTADTLLARAWPSPLLGLFTQQIAEPREEMRCRAEIPRLTVVEDDVSRQVQQQYEENPYPRWVEVGRIAEPTTLASWLPMLAPEAGPEDATAGDILIAGCGTGQQAIETAQQFPGARVLAVDLSLSSLAYAQRKTRALGLSNIDYAQADILHLDAIGRRFDLIESTGVLHHMGDPLAGLRVLVKLLRPRGLIHLGLYSESGRHPMVEARRFIAQRGYRGTAADIRRCRQELMAEKPADLPDLAELSDFFSTSACRDLLFHVAERRLTLPEIEAFLAAEGLALVGFQVGPHVAERYRRTFPADAAMTDLANWHSFERQHPYAFSGMYLFWVRRRS